MRFDFLSKILSLTALLCSIGLFAKETPQGEDTPEGTKAEIQEYIQHHLQDSHDFNLFSYTNDAGEKVHVGFPLPVILWDDGLKVFSSARFHHGEEVAEVDGNYYVLHHSKIYKTNAAGDLNMDAEDHPTNAKPLDFSITKSVVMMLVTGLLLIWLFSSLARSYAKNGHIPRGIGRFFEPIVLYIRDDIAIANIGEKKYKRYMPFLLTVFFFIWFLNMFGLTPLGPGGSGQTCSGTR